MPRSAPAGAGTPTKCGLPMTGASRLHVEAREPEAGADREDRARAVQAASGALGERQPVDEERRRDAEVDEVGERVELGAEAAGGVEPAGEQAVEAVEERRRR